MNHHLNTSILALCICGMIGCGTSHESESAASGGRTETVDTARYVLTEEPGGAIGVTAAREQAQDKEPIVIVGRIGGQKNPWIDGRAAFMMIDAAMSVVADGEETAESQVCMDDCCATLRAECTTLVKIVDDRGKPLPIDGRALLNADVDDMVVVKGTVHRDEDEGTFSIAACGVYVRR